MFFGWDCEYIRPDRKIYVDKKCYNFFAENNKLKKVEKDYFDFSAYTPATPAQTTTNWYCIFRYCGNLEEIEDVGMQGGGYYYTFGWCYKLHTVETLRFVKEGGYYNPFTRCEEFQHIKNVEGEIGTSFTMKDNPKLTPESAKKLITHLVNYKGTDNEGTYTFTLNSTTWTNLEASGKPFDDELTGDESLTWRNYVVNVLGWNT